MAFLQLLKKDGKKFKGCESLTKEQLKEVLMFDQSEFENTGEHIITNYPELQAQLDAMNNHG